MIRSLINMSLRHRLVVVFFVLLVGVLGVRAADELPIDAVPDVTNVQVQVLTNAPSLGPLEIERFVTVPVETVMSGLPGLEELRSVSRFGVSAVTLVFEEGTDMLRARQLVDERLGAAREAVPDGYGDPQMGPISSGLGEIYQFEVRGEPSCGDGPDTPECWSAIELRTLLDWELAFALRQVEGVVEVNSFGGELQTYEVQVDPDRLLALNIGLDRVFEALRRNNANAGGASIERAGEQRLIRGVGLLESIADIESVVVATRDHGTPIVIGDLGEVRTAPMVRQGAVTRDGRGEVVTGIVMMLLGENAEDVSARVEARIDELRLSLPSGVTVETFYNRTELVDRTTRTVAKNLIEGGVLVIVVLLLLLGNVRGGLLVASVIPLAMLATFIGMRAMGVAGNLMSLGALDFGLIVDGAVVVVENCVRVLGQQRKAAVKQSIARATLQVGRPVAFAVGIIILVYAPILTLDGIEGKMFRPMALTVIFALAASVVLALTYVPAMATVVFRKGAAERETWLLRGLQRVYLPLLRRTLKWPRVTGGVTLAAFAGSLLLVPGLGAEFLPSLDEGSIAIQAVRLPSVSLQASVDATTRVERELLEHFPTEVKTVVSRTGRPEIATDPMGVEMTDVVVMLHPPANWQAANKEELVAEMATMMAHEFPGQAVTFSQPIELRTNELISGARTEVAINIYGEDLDMLTDLAADVVRVVSSVPGAADVSAQQVAGLPFLTIKVDRPALARSGAHAKDVLDAVSAMGGLVVGEVFEGQKRFALQVRFPQSSRDDLESIRRIPISVEGGAVVPLGQLAKISLDEGPASISRENVQRRLVVQANVRGRDLAGFVREAQQRVREDVKRPPGTLITWGGQFEHLEAATGRLAIAVPVALLLIFILLQINYGAVRPALLIYLNVPIAATGGLVALVVRDMPFSISAGVGFIALFGIAVLNGVVLISHVRDLQDEGVELAKACEHGARDRLRPVLMTALTDMLGFLPMAIAVSAGSEVQRPLATVVIGGLVSSTLLTLLVLPSIYAWLGERTATREPG